MEEFGGFRVEECVPKSPLLLLLIVKAFKFFSTLRTDNSFVAGCQNSVIVGIQHFGPTSVLSFHVTIRSLKEGYTWDRRQKFVDF
jgi:hypothetical protein